MNFRYQAVALGLSVLGLLGVFELIRRRRIQDVLWLPWLLLAVLPALVGLWIRPWAELARWLGILYEPLLLVAFASAVSFAMLLYLSVVISTLIRKNLRLAQEVAWLRQRVEALASEDARDRS